MIFRFLLALILLFHFLAASPQGVTTVNPDSIFLEWLESAEWEGISMNPDIALDWLLDLDSATTEVPGGRPAVTHMVTMSVPVNAPLLTWLSDSGDLVPPVSMRYRIKVVESRHWEYRFQSTQNAGDTCFGTTGPGVPENISSGFLIRPGELFREVVLGDFQVNLGFGAVAGSSPAFSVSIGNPGSLQRTGKGIRLHSGTATGRYLRGLATSFNAGRSEVVVFGSGKGQTNEEVAGLGWKRSFTNSEIGVAGIRIVNQFPPVIKDGWSAALQPDSGCFSRIGIYGQQKFPAGIVFGEIGWSPNGGYGWIAGIRWFEANGFSAVLRTSGCSAAYPVTYSVFQSGSSLTREGQRVIFSCRYAPARKLEWFGSAEINLSQWPGARPVFNTPSTRISQQLKYVSKGQRTISGSLQVDFQESSVSRPDKLTWKLAFDSDARQSGNFRFRAGIRQQWQGFGTVLSKGTTVDCSLTNAPADKKIRITIGLRVFTVEPGMDPLYAYEPDVKYGFSAPVLSGSGTRCYLTLRWKILKRVETEIKITQTGYSDLKHLNDGNPGGMSAKVQISWRPGV